MKITKLAKPQVGIGLVELMIASLIGLFLMGGLMQMFITSRQTYKQQDAVSRLQENGRFAMDFLIRDIRGTSSWGCFNTAIDANGDVFVVNFLKPPATGVAFSSTFDTGIRGEDNHVSSGSSDPVLANTDTLSVINSAAVVDTLTGAEVVITNAPTSASAALEVSPNSGINAGDILFVSDCDLGDVFQVTGVTTASDKDTLTHTLCNTSTCNPSPGNNNGSLSKAYRLGSNFYKVSFLTYDIRNGESGQPALFKTENTNAAQELIEGVEDMQILYGEDLGADGSADYYVRQSQVGNMSRVVSVKISLLVRSLENNLTASPVPYTFNGTTTTPPAGDLRIRRVFSSVVAIRNRLN